MGEGTRTLFGRIVLQNQDFFWGFMDQVASEMHTDVSVKHVASSGRSGGGGWGRGPEPCLVG